ncbi:MAG TPA: diguanylate cyclase [Negativicutes bacterium]
MTEERKPLIMIVDDNPYNLQIIAVLIENSGYESVLAQTGQQVFDFVSKEKPDLILLDIMMPEIDGYEVCRILQQDETTRQIPIIFLTAKVEAADIVKGLEAGAVDYITKPFNTIELQARIKTHLELKKVRDDLKQSNKQLQEVNTALQAANQLITVKNQMLKEMMEQLEYAAKVDALTGLFNRRYAVEKIEEEVARQQRNQKSFSFLMADIDFFKKVNDTYGHDGGDHVLKAISQMMQQTIREQDWLARWGGEEFLMLLPESDLAEAMLVAERIRQKIEENVIDYQKMKIAVTITLGVATYDGTEPVEQIIKKADNALYDGKASGRNCVVAAVQ